VDRSGRNNRLHSNPDWIDDGRIYCLQSAPHHQGVYNTNDEFNRIKRKGYLLQKEYYKARDNNNWGLANKLAYEIGENRRIMEQAEKAFEKEALNMLWNIGSIGVSIYNKTIPALGIIYEAGKAGMKHLPCTAPDPVPLSYKEFRQMQNFYKRDPRTWVES
jgi:hypothetical protein